MRALYHFSARGRRQRRQRPRQADEARLRLGEQARRVGQRLLGVEAQLQRLGQLGLDQLANVLVPHAGYGKPTPRHRKKTAGVHVIAFLLLALAQDPTARAREAARKLPFARDAMLELRREAAAIPDPALRAAVEAQILAP